MTGVYGVVKGRCPCHCTKCTSQGDHEVGTGWESELPNILEYYCPNHPDKIVIRDTERLFGGTSFIERTW